MRPIHEQSNEEKAVLLHQFMPYDIGGLLTHLEAFALTFLRKADEHKKDWDTAGINVAFDNWLQLATDVAGLIKHQRKTLAADPSAFASELFTGYKGIFTVFYLQYYSAICTYRFSYVLRFLFDIEPAAKLPFDTDTHNAKQS